ncbi:hypothetical protein ACGWZA_000257 [Enterococcus hirae]|uniref:hypothetical protein n=1 Tax=Enterococcus TaxID=1350 RepID=UPI00159AEDBF|nr:hypothetical protein [Enterococcus hirae]QKX68298.1 hypothetical protein HU255_03865 [Enterococcus hirae]
MSWYKPEYMGTIADWIGILVTALTIFLTVKYYLNDNKREFRIVLYPLYVEENNGINIGYRKPVFFEFYAVNFSKNPDSVYFYTIRPKHNILKKLFFKIPNDQLSLSNPFEERIPEYQTLDSKEKTKIEKVKIELLYQYISSLYGRTKRNKYLKEMTLEIVYLNVEGKEFSKPIVFSIESIQEYMEERKRMAREFQKK